jgi:hypothetical protein
VARPVIATYKLNYQKGKVMVLGIYSDDVVFNSKFDKFFGLLLQHTLSRAADKEFVKDSNH